MGRRIDFVRNVAERKNWLLIEKNNGEIVSSQKFVRAQGKNEQDTLIVFLKSLQKNAGKYTIVPNVVGKMMRDAVSALAKNHLKVYVRGSGVVRHQIPDAGTKMRKQARCIIECEPPIELSHLRSFE